MIAALAGFVCATAGIAGPASARASARAAAPHGAAHRARRHRACAARSRSLHARRATRRCLPAAHGTPRHKATPRPTATPSALATQGAVIASVLATACQNTELTPEAANIALVRASVLCLVNRVRAQHGEDPLGTNPDLERAAEEHAGELVAQNYFAHIAPDGRTPVDRARSDGYLPSPQFGYVIGENLAWGTLNLSTPRSIVAAWVASPGHLANILETQYRDTGIGVTPAVPASLGNGQQGATYAQEFGIIIA
jgi:uncharacterized protein YkwD